MIMDWRSAVRRGENAWGNQQRRGHPRGRRPEFDALEARRMLDGSQQLGGVEVSFIRDPKTKETEVHIKGTAGNDSIQVKVEAGPDGKAGTDDDVLVVVAPGVSGQCVF